ncbi:MAG: leucine-rich repeat protein [Clostridia bacterium]|nr:leucine-rich repeat protein [Clostridia bacterium]
MNRKLKISTLLILCIALTGTMLFFGTNTLKAEATEREITASGTSSNVNWTLYDDGELYIDGAGYWLATPWKSHYSSIKKITIAKDVTASTALNFYFNISAGYENLETVIVEDGNTAFYADENGVLYSYDKTKLFLFPNASGLTEYNIPDSVTTVISGAFCGNKTITGITGCNGLKTIEENAFYFCSSLKNITLPGKLTTIGNYAFFKCASLEEITISNNVTTLGNYAFKGCTSLAEISIGNDITEIPTEAFMDCTVLETVALGTNVKTIGMNAFKNCISLSDITLPDSVVSIKEAAFYNCTSIKSIVIPEGVTSLPTSAFNECTSLENITVPASLISVSNYAFKGCSAVKNVYYTGNSAGWCSIRFIGATSNPLYYAENLYVDGNLITEFVVPDEITEIKNYLFAGYDKLKSVTIPDSVTSIGAYAFYYCTGLESIVIPDSVTQIHNQAFAYCTNLTDISASDNLEYIGADAFMQSGYSDDYANWDNGFLYLENYLLDIDDNTVAVECNLYSKTKLVASRAFYNCDKIKSVTMSNGVEHINTEAFYSCGNLESVKLSANLKKIEESSFAGCPALTSIVIPQNVTAIEGKAFYGCSSLTEIEIPESVSAIGGQAFCGCVTLEKVIINEGLTEIGGKAFADNPLLAEIYLPESLTALTSTAFNSSGVTDIYYSSTKANWKRVSSGATFSGITVHYTLKSDDEAVIINHTDGNFDYEAGNVHLVVEDLGDATSSYEQNGFYNRLMVDPIQVLDIKLVDGDGNDIQPLSDETITVKIKASDEFMNLMKSGLSAVSEYDINAEDIDFFNDCFVFEFNGEKVSVPADESFLKKFKIIHWYSDAAKPTDHESFTHDEISVENGYIILKTNHFSEYAVCTELVTAEDYIIKWIIDGVVTEQTVTEESAITKPVNPEKEGYTFIGWTPEVPDTMPAENLEFTAVWQVNKYTITFDTAGGTVIAPVALEYGATITSPVNPEKYGYAFIGWTPELPETMPANDLTVVAVYEEIETPDVPEPPKVTVKGIKILSLPHKTQYTYKVDSLDLSGLAIKMMYSDGTTKIISDTKAITAYGFDVDSVGTKTITVSYGGYTDEFEITVSYAWWQWIIRILLFGFIWY